MPAVPQGFNELYKRNYAAVYRVCYIYMQSVQDAEDCTEDAFLKLINMGMTFNDENHERAWLTVVAANICKDRLKHWWRKKTEDIADHEDIAGESGEMHNDVLEAVMALPTKYKEVVILFYYEGYKTEEISRLVKKPASTVRNLLRDARTRLKAALGGDFDEQ